MAHVCWEINGEVLGPTFNYYNKQQQQDKDTYKEIKEIMDVESLPDDIEIIWPVWSTPHGGKAAAEASNKLRLKVADNNAKFVGEILKGIDGIKGISSHCIHLDVGRHIDAKLSHHCVKFDYCGDIIHLDNPKEREKFRKEIIKRIKGRIKRGKRSKSIKGRTTNIGSYGHVTQKSIERAEFAVYLNPDQEIVEADVEIVGTVKFYKKSSRNALFDIDKGKIFTRDGKTEIKADNTKDVMAKLLECLAGVKNG